MSSKEKYDAIIMGAGSTGSSIAYHLAKKGLSNILVLDASCAGCGQTSRSSAIIRLHYTNPVIREMAVHSWRFWNNFQDETECEYPVFTKTGVVFAGPEEYRMSMKNVVENLKKLGADVSLYNAENFKRDIFKYMNVDDLSVIAWEPDSGYGDPNTSVRCFLEYAVNAGAEVKEYTAIKRLVKDDEKIIAVETEKGVFNADFIVNALGVWTNNVLKTIGITLPIEIGVEDVLYLQNPPNREVVPPGWEDLRLGFYSRPEGNRYTLVGSLDAESTDQDPIPGEYSVPPIDVVTKRSTTFTKRFPDMITASPYRVWFGFFDITPDWQPIIGFDSKVENLVHMVGLSGHGFKLAPAFGEVISDIVLHGDSKRFDVSDFNLKRFSVKESRHSEYKYGIVG